MCLFVWRRGGWKARAGQRTKGGKVADVFVVCLLFLITAHLIILQPCLARAVCRVDGSRQLPPACSAVQCCHHPTSPRTTHTSTTRLINTKLVASFEPAETSSQNLHVSCTPLLMNTLSFGIEMAVSILTTRDGVQYPLITRTISAVNYDAFTCFYRPLSSDLQDEWRQCKDSANHSLHAWLL